MKIKEMRKLDSKEIYSYSNLWAKFLQEFHLV